MHNRSFNVEHSRRVMARAPGKGWNSVENTKSALPARFIRVERSRAAAHSAKSCKRLLFGARGRTERSASAFP